MRDFDWTRDLHEREHRVGFDATSKSTAYDEHGQPTRPWPLRIEMDRAVRDRVEATKSTYEVVLSRRTPAIELELAFMARTSRGLRKK